MGAKEARLWRRGGASRLGVPAARGALAFPHLGPTHLLHTITRRESQGRADRHPTRRWPWSLPYITRDQSTLKLCVFGLFLDRNTDEPVHRQLQDTGNKVSRRATISGPQNIILGGKTIIANGAIIRGDLRRTGPGHAVVISLGRYCLIGVDCVMRLVQVQFFAKPV